MRTKKVICRVCEKKLELFYKVHLSSSYAPEYRNPKSPTYGKIKRTFSYWDSKEGIFFKYGGNSYTGVWFCNCCWEKIISKIKNQS